MRRSFDGSFIANGGFTVTEAEGWINEDRADAISFGRMFLANPDLPARIAANGPYNNPEKETFYGGGDKGYTDYPTLST